jgi:acetoacetyl-CoA synthetase
LKPGGVRFGSAELYNVMANFTEEVIDSLAVGSRKSYSYLQCINPRFYLQIGQKYHNDERVIMFCKMKDCKEFTPELEKRIRAKIRDDLSPRFDIPEHTALKTALLTKLTDMFPLS